MRAPALAVLLMLAGCREKVLPEPDFERMIRQEKCKLWDACDRFEDGRTAQHPPDGTIAQDAVIGRPGYRDGIAGGQYVAQIPIPLTVPLVQRGRQRFETFCAPCHGILGDGSSRVATNMMLRLPPSLIGERARSFAPGRIYQVIAEGYGLMPSYAEDMPSIDDRWAVVAYLEALQRSRAVEARTLPPELRARAEEVLK